MLLHQLIEINLYIGALLLRRFGLCTGGKGSIETKQEQAKMNKFLPVG